MIAFNKSIFEKIFPFYIRIDKNMKIVSSGISIRKMLGEVNEKSFHEVFKFIRPSMSIRYEFQSLKEHQDIVIILESIDYPIKTRFRGQFVYFPEVDEILYLNSPWVSRIEDLSHQNLRINDFAIHDAITDNLLMMQSKDMVNKDLKAIAAEMTEQRNELLVKNETIIELARFPDQNPQPIFRIDFEGKLLYANEHGLNLVKLKHLLDLSFWGTIYLRFESNGFKTYEKQITLDNQTFHATIVPFESNGYFNVYLNDITKTVDFQNELLNTSARLQVLLSSMQSAILAEDSHRKIILVNQTFCDLFSIPIAPELMKGEDCTNAAEQSKVLFKDERGFIDRVEEVLKGKQKVFGDVLYLKDGRVLERDYLPIYEEGKYSGHIWKYQDISEQLKAKVSLQKVEDKYQKIVETLKVGFMEVDLDEKITKVYPAFCEMTGYTEKDLLGENARNLLLDDLDSETMDFQNNLRKKGDAGVYEVRIRTKDGSRKWVIISGVSIVDENDIIIGSLGLHVDISSQKQLEADLIVANQKANTSVNMKQLFLANMSHEIRTPLNVIIGMTDLINEDELLLEQRKYVQTIKKSADSLLDLVNDLLDYSKIESGQFELEQKSFNLFELIVDLENSFTEKAQSKNIQLLTKIDKNINSNLISDSSKLNQVFVNLTSNALKFTDAGFIKIYCTLINDTDDVQLIRFTIEDSGIGIEKENIEKIFQTFTQADATISRQFGGTGLGLSISKEIVLKFGGELKVKSEIGKGSCFSFEIEFKKGVIEVGESKKIISKKYDLTDIKILVAEDNALNQILIRAILSKEGIAFDLVENGYEAIQFLGQNKYDIVLMDIQMPKMDGVSATQYIRELVDVDIPILGLTANASKEDKEIYKSAGMNDSLSKPFRKDALFAMIFKYTSKARIQSIEELDLSCNSSKILPYSLSELEEIGGSDTEFILSIIDTFRQSAPGYLNQISVGLVKNEMEAVKKAAHQLKPSLDIFLIQDASKLIRDLEEQVLLVDHDIQYMKKIFAELKKIVNEVIKDLYSKF